MTETELRARVCAVMAGWVGGGRGSAQHREILSIYNSQPSIPRGYKMRESDDWCAATVSAAFLKAGIAAYTGTECSCGAFITIAKARGIWIEDEYVRAVRGGIGFAKTGGNYAASLIAQQKAHDAGFSQVLWLDGVERKYIEEVGAMNVMFLIGDEIVTPMLSGSILPGITRKSCIEVLKKEGYTVHERLLSIDELKAAMENGTLEEAWGCGTAAVVSPIDLLSYEGTDYVINDGKITGIGTHDELIDSNAEYTEIFYSQMDKKEA